MKAVVGLGNPGTKYENTRHNVGFQIIDTIYAEHRMDWTESRVHRAEVDRESVRVAYVKRTAAADREAIFLAKPLTYMNQSGLGLKVLLQDFGVSLKDLLVVCDDVNLPLGRLRLRASGSSGGHNGLQSIIDTLETENFARLRVGVGSEPKPEDLSDYVLSGFKPDEFLEAKTAVRTAVEAVLYWFERGTEAVMNEFNRIA